MVRKSISIRDSFQFGWKAVSGNFQYFVGLCILVFAGKFIPKIVLKLLLNSIPSYIYLTFSTANLIWQTALSMFVLKICLRLSDGQSMLLDLWDSSSSKTLINFFVNSIFQALIIGPFVILALLGIRNLPDFKFPIIALCASPVLIILGRIYFASFLIVDIGLGPIDALKSSWIKTEGLTGELFGFTILFILINFVGVLTGIVGMAFAYPVAVLTVTSLYRQLVPSKAPDSATSLKNDTPMDPRRFI